MGHSANRVLRLMLLCCVLVAGGGLCRGEVLLQEDFDDGDFTTGVSWRVPFGEGSWQVRDGRLVGAAHVSERKEGYPNGNCLVTGFEETARPIKAHFYFAHLADCPTNSVSISLLNGKDGPGGVGYTAMAKFQYKHCKFHLSKRTASGPGGLAATHGPTDEAGRWARFELRVLPGERVEMWYDHVLVAAASDSEFQSFDTILINNEHQQGHAKAAFDDVVVETASDSPPEDFPARPTVRKFPGGPDDPGAIYVLADSTLQAHVSCYFGGNLIRLVHNANAPGARTRWMPSMVWWGRGMARRPGVFCPFPDAPTAGLSEPEINQTDRSASVTFGRTLTGGLQLAQTFSLSGTGALACKLRLRNGLGKAEDVALTLQGEPLRVADARIGVGFDEELGHAFVCSPDYNRSVMVRQLPEPSSVSRVSLDYILDEDMNIPRLGIGLSGDECECRFEVPYHPGHHTELTWRGPGAEPLRATRQGARFDLRRKGRIELRITPEGVAGALDGNDVLSLEAEGAERTRFDDVYIAVNGARMGLLSLSVSSPKGESPAMEDSFARNWQERYVHVCPGVEGTIAVRPKWYYFYVPRPTDILAWRALPGRGVRRQRVERPRGWMAFVETTFRRGLALAWRDGSGHRIELSTTPSDVRWQLHMEELHLEPGSECVREFTVIPFVGLTGVSAVRTDAVIGAHPVAGQVRVFRPRRPWQLDFLRLSDGS